MECYSDTCKRPSDDQFTCDNCYIPQYCSEHCKAQDASAHEPWCRPRIFSLKDFAPVKSARKVLDVGTYGEVQLMQNTINHRLYAIKIIRKSLVADVIPLKYLFREIMIHKTLVHPNVVRLVDHFEDVTKIYLALEYVDKGSLFNLIRNKIKLSESEACNIFTQIAIGLSYLHENNIIHRDIKPENILISKQNKVKICDFDWCSQGGEKRTTFCGTLEYLSPEMINSDPYTEKIDIWALGVLLYEMLHGTPPFRAKSPKEQYRLIAAKSFNIGSHVSKQAAQVIRNILQLKPESRPSLIELLKSQWVQTYSESKLKQNWRVSDLTLGDGVITNVTGKIVTISHEKEKISVIEDEMLRKYVVYDEKNNLVHTPPQEEAVPARFDPLNPNITLTPLYKKLGIDSGRATPINNSNSARNSRPNSRLGSPMSSPRPTIHSREAFEGKTENSPVAKERRPPVSPKYEEVKMSQQLPPRGRRRPAPRGFDEINLSPETVPSTMTPKSRPRSTFLKNFAKGFMD